MTDNSAAENSGVAHAVELLALADAMVGSDDAALDAARADVLQKLGPEQLVDAVAVASNFERMPRIADAIGIPLDANMNVMTVDIRDQLGLDSFSASANTSAPGTGLRILNRIIRPLAVPLMRIIKRFVG